ncbi:MAG: 16S rRNA (guanine(966)-N(2))-methyltransferase RsmD [Firmicutes bacterium]|nr:16S rRNA (guanine(966)-N(2))-methyltransferase RsmD [Bacillota bacterium]
MRIIGGQASGRRLASLAGSDTRPTGDRVREALFNIWQSRVPDARFFDAYAGTGAMGLEALSRGAARAVFAEPHRGALKTLRRNVELVGLADRAEVWPVPCEEAMAAFLQEGRQFDIIFCDPPWAKGLSDRVRMSLGGIVAPHGMVVVESRQSDAEVFLDGLEPIWTRRYGDTRLTAYQQPDAN